MGPPPAAEEHPPGSRGGQRARRARERGGARLRRERPGEADRSGRPRRGARLVAPGRRGRKLVPRGRRDAHAPGRNDRRARRDHGERRARQPRCGVARGGAVDEPGCRQRRRRRLLRHERRREPRGERLLRARGARGGRVHGGAEGRPPGAALLGLRRALGEAGRCVVPGRGGRRIPRRQPRRRRTVDPRLGPGARRDESRDGGAGNVRGLGRRPPRHALRRARAPSRPVFPGSAVRARGRARAPGRKRRMERPARRGGSVVPGRSGGDGVRARRAAGDRRRAGDDRDAARRGVVVREEAQGAGRDLVPLDVRHRGRRGLAARLRRADRGALRADGARDRLGLVRAAPRRPLARRPRDRGRRLRDRRSRVGPHRLPRDRADGALGHRIVPGVAGPCGRRARPRDRRRAAVRRPGRARDRVRRRAAGHAHRALRLVDRRGVSVAPGGGGPPRKCPRGHAVQDGGGGVRPGSGSAGGGRATCRLLLAARTAFDVEDASAGVIAPGEARRFAALQQRVNAGVSLAF